jgi:hypothetical protein
MRYGILAFALLTASQVQAQSALPTVEQQIAGAVLPMPAS